MALRPTPRAQVDLEIVGFAGAAERIPSPVAARSPATASLYIVPGLGRGDSLFSTHPSTENRIAALMAMTGRAGPPSEARPRQSALDPLRRRG